MGDTGAPSPTDAVANPFADHPILAGGFANVAHRGGALLWPEETLLALGNAIDAGADMLEVDVWQSSDGVLVLMHDDTVERTTDGVGSVRELDWATLSGLDAGYRFTTDGGATYPYRGTGVTVARLEDALAAHPDALWSIEIKQQDPPIVGPLLELLDAAGALDRVVIGSFYDPAIAEVRAARPDVLTSMGTTEGLSFFYADEADYEPPAWYLAAPTSLGDIVLDEATITKAHRFGVAVHVWTVNDPTEMQTFLDWGVDGIITDDPVALGALIE